MSVELNSHIHKPSLELEPGDQYIVIPLYIDDPLKRAGLSHD